MTSGDDRAAGIEVVPKRTRRERVHQQTMSEIKQAARQQIEDNGGAGALSLRALAHELGMAGPSLYRYVSSRDELMTQVLVEAYTELAESLETAVSEAPDPRTPADRLRGYARAYRRWAIGRPAMYELLFGRPVSGYTAPEEATAGVARRSMAGLVTIVSAWIDDAHAGDPSGPRTWAETVEESAPGGDILVLAVRTWARLHGLVSLEIRGHLAHLVASTEALYEAEIDLTIEAMGRAVT